jgi:hypothetical protein
MKISKIVAYLKRAAADMQDFAASNDDMDLPSEVVLPFIMNFLTKTCCKCRRLGVHFATEPGNVCKALLFVPYTPGRRVADFSDG